ncbi:MAG: ORF6N domain-containing protein [Prevotellaceae bacterium]|jgi:hypothetical protein|nr:ORF6N domain-containing protein [Prevotellaceae bacterium]
MELQTIQNKIYEIRGERVMLDFDLAQLYEVETKRLKESVRRNINRFPPDFMFELTETEYKALKNNLRTQFATSNNRGGIRYMPFAFTEQGVGMLASVLNSAKAIDLNISIIRAFVILHKYALGYAELNKKLEEFMIETDLQFNEIYQALTELAEKKQLEEKPIKPIGYHALNL